MLQIATDIFRKRLALFHKDESGQFMCNWNNEGRSPLVLYICTPTYTAKGVSCFFLFITRAVQSLSLG